MIETCDFPAAHSMDTIWFAIDAEGNLGIFRSGENGPVPTLFTDQDMGDRVQDVIQEEVMAGRLPLDLSLIKEKSEEPHVDASVFDTHGLPPGIQFNQMVPPKPSQPLWSTLTFGLYQPKPQWTSSETPPSQLSRQTLFQDNVIAEVSSWEALQALGLSATIVRLVSTNDAVLVGFDKLTKQDWELLHSKEVCIFCCNLDVYFETAAACGFFHYDGDPSWYQLEHRPMKPVKLADVEDKLPAELPLLHLPFKFAEQPQFQPLITMECNTWGDTPCYSLPGTTTREQIKPIPGKEAEYRKWYEEEYLPHRDDWYQDVAVELPALQNP